MFEGRLIKSSLLRKIVDAIKELVTEGNWDCTDDGIHLQNMDSSHVALVAVSLKSDGFDTYRCDRGLSLGINLGSMSKIFKCSGSDDIVTLRAEDAGDELTFVFESPNQDRISEYELKLMDIDSEHLGIPDIKYDSVVTMPSGEFRKIIEDLTQFGDTVTITCTKTGVQFSVKGDVLGNAKVTLNETSGADSGDRAVDLSITKPCTLCFSLKYLKLFAKGSSLAGKVQISLSSNSPMAVEYRMADDEGGDYGTLAYYLAPKMEDEDEEES